MNNNMHEAEDRPGGGDSGVDLQAVLAMAGGDMALLRDLARAFLAEVPQLVDALHQAVDRRNGESLQAAAHQLQGVMRCLHMDRALDQARQLEERGEEPVDWPAIEGLLVELKSTIDSAMKALDEFLGR